MHPPGLARRFLEWAARGGASGDSLPGDLHEEYVRIRRRRGRAVADLWYLAQAVSIGGTTSVTRAVARLKGRGLRWAAGFALDLRATLRGLASHPAVSLVAVASLTLGIGLTGCAVAFVNALWVAPLPFPHADRLLDLEDTHAVEVCAGCSAGASYASFLEWRDLPVFESVEALRGARRNLGTGAAPRPVMIAEVTAGLPELLGATVSLGRGITAEDARPGAPPVIVLTHGLWADAFGEATDAIGRTVELDGTGHVVIGVLDEEVRLLDRARAWVPLTSATPSGYGTRDLWVVARHPADVTPDVANEVLAAHASSSYAADASLEPGWSARARPLRTALEDGTMPPAIGGALVVATSIVLLIACLNLAAVLLARTVERTRELGIRLAIGSGRGRALRFVAMESAVLALFGGACALALCALGLGVADRRLTGVFPGWVALELDGGVFAVMVAVTALVGGICAALPLGWARRVSGGAAHRVGRALRRGPGRMVAHDLLLAGQVVLGVLLIGGGVAAVRTLATVSDFDTLGHRYAGLHSVGVSVPEGHDRGLVARQALVERVSESLLALPPVGGVAVARTLFLGSWGAADAGSPVWVDGAGEAVSNRVVPRHSLAVSAGYLELFEIEVLAGRSILPSDDDGAEPAAVVSRSAAAALWPDAAPERVVGRGFRVVGPEQERRFTVVGVAADVVVNVRSESRRPQPRIYTAIAQTPVDLLPAVGTGLTFHLDVRGGPPDPDAVQRVLSTVDPELALARYASVESELRQWIIPTMVTASLLGVLATIAVGLLVLGVYGTLRYRIATRRREVGIRMALGARPGAILHAITRRQLIVLGSSLAVGGVVARVVGGSFGGGDVPLGTPDLPALGVVLVLLTLAVLAAGFEPLRAALRTDAVDALRAD